MNDQEKLLQKLDAHMEEMRALTGAIEMLVKAMSEGDEYYEDEPNSGFLNQR